MELYHYTTAKGLIGILEGESIWATNIKFLNDKSEHSHTIEMLKKRLKDKTPVPTCETILEELGRYTYVTSFSACGNLLSQWRSYCPIGGFSIGFDFQKLKNLEKAPSRPGILVELSECVYDKSKQEAILDEIIADWQHRDPTNFEALSSKVSEIAPIFKDQSFGEEKEWRLVIIRANFELKFREGKTGVIPFFDISLGGTPDSFPIKSITIGPTPTPRESELAVRLLLNSKKNLPDIAIHDSKIPYREI